MLDEEELDSDGFVDDPLEPLGGVELAPGVEEELPGVELELPGAVDEPEEAAPGLDGVDEAPEDEEDGGGVLLLVPLVLDSLLKPANAAATAAAQHSLASVPKVLCM